MNTHRNSLSSEDRFMTLHRRTARRELLGLIAGFALLAPLSSGTVSAQTFGFGEHAPLPRMETQGGAVLSQARIVPIYYSADPVASGLSGYFAALGTSGYLQRGLGQYGVQSVTVANAVALPDAPPPSVLDTDIASWLVSEIAAGAFPAEDGNTAYQIVYPVATQVNEGGLYGYSYQTCYPFTFETYSATGTPIPFSVVPQCGFPAFAGLTGIDWATTASSASLANVATAPFTNEQPAYVSPSWYGSGWAEFTNYGVGQLCLALSSEATSVPEDLGFRVVNIWSNRAARDSHNPCTDTSAPPSVYFNAAPDIVGGTVPYAYAVAKGLIIPASGGSVTIPVRLFSDGPTEEWTLSATERLDLDYQPAAVLTFSFDKATGRSGDVRQLTITRAATDYPGSALAFEITSTLNGVSHGWEVLVGND